MKVWHLAVVVIVILLIVTGPVGPAIAGWTQCGLLRPWNTVACGDTDFVDDDVAALNNRIAELEATRGTDPEAEQRIAELEAQIAAINGDGMSDEQREAAREADRSQRIRATAEPNNDFRSFNATGVGDGQFINWPAFKAMLDNEGVNNPYTLKAWLDNRPGEKRDHPVGGWTTSCTALVLTGWYTEPQELPAGVEKLLVDGRTGTFVVAQGVEVPSPGAEYCLSNYDGVVPYINPIVGNNPRQAHASACAEATIVRNLIDANNAINPEAVFRGLDEYVDNHPGTRLTSGEGDSGSFQLNSGESAFIWTTVGAEISVNAETIVTSAGKKLVYITQNGNVSVNWAFSGVKVCNNTQMATSTAQPTHVQGATLQPGSTQTSGVCIPTNLVVQTISSNRGDENRLYGALETLAGQYPNGVRSGNAGSVTGNWLKTLLVVNDGATGPVIAIDTSVQHSTWLFTEDGTAQVHASYKAFSLCTDLNPERDFDWWGR